MPADLLSTKLYIPAVRPDVIRRPRLFDRVIPSATNRVVLVAAPAGYGKTTLVSSWLRESHCAAAWLSLEESDNDPVRFLQYVVRASQEIIPTLQVERAVALEQVSPTTLVNPIINAIAQQAAPLVLVLDDFHMIHAQPVLDMVALLVERMPPHMRLILLSRTDPPLPIARWRARGQMVEVRASHLRLTQEETAFFLNTVMHLAIPEDDLAALDARTEGWIAGLQLAGLSMQGCHDLHSFIAAFTGSHHYIMDYLLEEVLKQQPEVVRTFLLETSILCRLCGPLCEAVIGDTAGRVDGQALLQDLEQRNLFLIPLDDERHWYRYHHLFADVLDRHLQRTMPGEVRALHRRACLWYAQNNLIPDAIRHALLAQDQERAVHLIEQNGCMLLIAGETATLDGWLSAIAPFLPTHPWLLILKGWVLTLSGQPEQVAPVLDAAERLLSGLDPSLESQTEVRIMRGACAAARAHSANARRDPAAAEWARQALVHLPEGDELGDSLRSVATLILGDASLVSGRLEEARQAYDQAARIGGAVHNPHLVILGKSDLADILVDEGQLELAAHKLSEALELANQAGSHSPMVGRVLAGSSRIAYERNDLPAAARYAQDCVKLSLESGNFEFAPVAHIVLARLAQLEGHTDQAREAMHAADVLAREHVSSAARSIWVQCTLATLELAQGNLLPATQLVDANKISLKAELSYAREPIFRVLLRLYVAQGDYARALALSDRLLQFAEANHRTESMVQVLALQAIAFQGQRELDQALDALAKALALAEPGQYARVFLDEGEPMARLLRMAQAHHLGTGFLTELLSALPAHADAAVSAPQPLVEPLSARELEVLELIAAGHSNEEIAAKLVISVKTAKRHISNIYGKLGAKSRTQAVALARELKIVE